MPHPLRVVRYLNRFFGGVGGEEAANRPVQAHDGAIGPGRALQQTLGSDATIVATDSLVKALVAARPDVVVAGPAFDAGRYGLACARTCILAQVRGIPAVSAMSPDNPGIASHRSFSY